VLETRNLTHLFGPAQGIQDLNLSVRTGEVFGFLGPNGAGKSTTINLLIDFLRPQRGWISLLGVLSREGGPALRARIGFLPGELRLPPDLTGTQALIFLERLSRRPATLRDAVVERLGLRPIDLSKPLRECSHGTRQRIGLVQAFQHDPELLVLDEPTTGLDPLMQAAFEELLAWTRARRRTVFLSSHNLKEVERTCDRVAIVRQSRLVAVESVETLAARALRRVTAEWAGPPAALPEWPGVETVVLEPGRLELLVPPALLPAVLRWLAQREIRDLTCERASLEDLFLGYYREAATA
jgi:ABC-2 type transport system ATP-binding protein